MVVLFSGSVASACCLKLTRREQGDTAQARVCNKIVSSLIELLKVEWIDSIEVVDSLFEDMLDT